MPATLPTHEVLNQPPPLGDGGVAFGTMPDGVEAEFIINRSLEV